MSELKQRLRLTLIENDSARQILTVKHPLGAGQAFKFALGIFWDDECEGVMSFGNPISNMAVRRYGLEQFQALELRKMWMSDIPPRNTESRALAIAARLIRQRYKIIKLLITYCDGEESASAYKASGWIPQEAHNYMREILYGGQWYSVRDANRKGITARADDARYETRRKYVLPLDASVAQLVERAVSNGETAVRARPGRSFNDSSTVGTSTVNSPSLPETGNGSIDRTLPSTQAKSPDSASQQAATSSPGRKGRTSKRSTKATATPIGKSP